jgi:hypothetical protein
MQLTASHVYVPSDVKSSGFAVNAKTSPALISFESLNHRKTGVGIPMTYECKQNKFIIKWNIVESETKQITLHSNETVPCSVNIARSSSTNSGDLYALGTNTLRVAKHEFLPPKFSAIHIHLPPSSSVIDEISRQ